MLVSIQDVADKAGVPLKTASRALAGKTLGKRSDAKERAERVLKAAKELGYQPSSIANALRSGRTMTLGIVIGGISNPYYGCFAETAFDEADKHGFKMIMEMTRMDRERAPESLRSLLCHRVDGILYAQSLPEKPDELHRTLMSNGFPVVTPHPNNYGYSSFRSDYRPGISQAVAKLRRQGHQKVSFSLSVGDPLRDKDMLDAYLDACDACGVKSDFIPRRRTDVSEVLRRKPAALLLDGSSSMNAFMKGAALLDGYAPDAIGFYNEWTWWQRAEGIAGAILLPSDDIVRGAVCELVKRINDGGAIIDHSFPTRFLPASTFAAFKARSLDSETLFEN